MPYILPSDVETLLNVDLTENGTDLVQALIDGLSAQLEAACNRSWNTSGNITEQLDGGAARLFPKQVPIASVVSLIDGLTPLVEGQDYYVYRTYIRLGFNPSSYPQRFTLVYTVANPFPADLKLALTRWVADVFVQRPDAQNYGVSKLTQGPVTIEYDRTKATEADPSGSAFPSYIQAAIKQHRLFNI